MEATMAQVSSHHKQQQMRSSRKISPYVMSKSMHQSMSAATNMYDQGGLLFTPPPNFLSFSYPPPSPALFNHMMIQYHNNSLNNYQQQPPLLPSPISKPFRYNSLPARTVSCPPSTKKIKKSKVTTKKSKPVKKEELPKKDSLQKAEAAPLGPDPTELPKDVSRVLSSSPKGSAGNLVTDFEKFSGSVFTAVSPPPSSLPLPKFSVRPKLACKAEADIAGATDNLRRMLRLQ